MEQKNKCFNCKYYMEITYKNGKGGKKKHCLKLEDGVSANVTVIECNQFVYKNKIEFNANSVKT